MRDSTERPREAPESAHSLLANRYIIVSSDLGVNNEETLPIIAFLFFHCLTLNVLNGAPRLLTCLSFYPACTRAQFLDLAQINRVFRDHFHQADLR